MGGANTKRTPVEILPAITNVTMVGFDPARFAGGAADHWFEVARIDNPLESECSFVSHTIRTNPTNLTIVTACYTQKDSRPTFIQNGILRIDNPNDPSKMVAVMEKWVGRGGIDFWVYDTDYDNYAIVGNTKGMLWLLTRRMMEMCKFRELYEKIKEYGFDVSPARFHVNVEYLAMCSAEKSRRR